jgi:hypothetical protein
MTRKNKIILYGGVSLLTISYIIYNRWSKRIFYDEVLKRIGGGTIKFDDLKVWDSSFLEQVRANGRAFAEYNQDVLREKSIILSNAIMGGGTDEDKIISVFSFFKSKTGVAQLVAFYNAKYGRSLKEDLILDLGDGYLSKIGSIISLKPDVIYTK